MLNVLNCSFFGFHSVLFHLALLSLNNIILNIVMMLSAQCRKLRNGYGLLFAIRFFAQAYFCSTMYIYFTWMFFFYMRLCFICIILWTFLYS